MSLYTDVQVSKVFLTLFLMVFMLKLHAGFPATYEELNTLGATCPPSDTCSQNRTLTEDNLLQQTCECKPSCRRYGTCCVDSPNRHLLRQKTKTSKKLIVQEICQSLAGTRTSIFVKNKCKQGRELNTLIKSLCEEKVKEFKDPIAVLPVTNPTTSITYKNYYCAFCNDDLNDLVFWNIRIMKSRRTSNSSEDENRNETSEAIENLIYNNETDQWGIVSNTERMARHYFLSEESTETPADEETFFEPVSMVFDYPSRLKESVTHCAPDVVSDCHPDWKDDAIKRKCQSYMGLIYSKQNTSQKHQRFRNVHCAICNFAGNKTNTMCHVKEDESTPSIVGASFSFTWLLDINPFGGNIVGEINRCDTGELYDPFFKKCRVMRCVKPEYKVTNGKCEPP